VACKGERHIPRTGLPEGGTGFQDTNGNSYVANGDPRVEEALKRPDNVVPAAKPGEPAKPAPKVLMREKLKEFEISRFDEGASKPSRFGDGRLELKVVFINNGSITFRGKLGGSKPNFKFGEKSGRYRLDGTLDDFSEESKGDFTLTDTKTGQTAQIFYWAYRTKLRLRRDRTKTSTTASRLEQELSAEHTFAWVNNWNVVRARSSYLVDIVHSVRGDSLPAERANFFTIKGESKQAAEGDVFAQTDAKNTRIQLMGNGESRPGRMFQVNVRDPKTNQEEEFMLDVIPVRKKAAEDKPAEIVPPEEPETFEPETQPAPPPAPPAPQESGGKPSAGDYGPGQAPKPQQPQPQPEEAVRIGKSFLRIDTSLPRTAKMTRDFNRNRNLDGVKTWINKFVNGNLRGNLRDDLQNFYTNSAVFRDIMEAVGQFVDVSPAFAYLTVVESSYFTGGRWELEWGKGTTAFGPFQLTEGAAKDGGVALNERRYFVPSSCGAAKYVRKLVDRFDDSDSTVAILAYFQGDGGAAAAIYCSFGNDVGDRKACARKINKKGGFNRYDYGRFLKLAKNYAYTYEEMENLAAIPKPMRDYVDKKLAIYFISNDFAKYGFMIPKNNLPRPNNDTIIPRGRLHDAECERATRALAEKIDSSVRISER
jgi:hypothetical protein